MNFKKVYFINFVFILSFLGCTKNEMSFSSNRNYIGFWAETKWTFNFKPDGKFILEK